MNGIPQIIWILVFLLLVIAFFRAISR